MKSIFDLEIQNGNIDGKITAGFERLSLVFKVLLWKKSKKYDMSPIQIQFLIFIKYHTENRATVSYLAKEFNLTKATVSDTVKILEQKKYVTKKVHSADSRSFTNALTDEGAEVVLLIENYTDALYDIVETVPQNEKLVLWKNISAILQHLNHLQLINIQSTCSNCKYFREEKVGGHCTLMGLRLDSEDIRIDCMDHKPNRLQVF